jgi:KTSC domain
MSIGNEVCEGSMQRTPVYSSNLTSVGYDQISQILEIEFHGGKTYQYLGIPRSVFDGLMGAPSKGRYFAYAIKDEYQCHPVA